MTTQSYLHHTSQTPRSDRLVAEQAAEAREQGAIDDDHARLVGLETGFHPMTDRSTQRG